MTQHERVKEVRKSMNLTLEKFGEQLGVGKTAISNIETGNRNLTDQMAKSICREFNVNEEWLRNGTGEMFLKPSNTLVAKAAQLLGQKDPVFEAFIETYSRLSPSDRAVLLKTWMNFSDNLMKYNSDINR